MTGVTHSGAIISGQGKALAWYQNVRGAEVADDNVLEFGGMKRGWLTVRIAVDNVEINLLPRIPGQDGKMPAISDANMVGLGSSECQAFYDSVQDKIAEICPPEDLP